jgi:phosphoribosylaminoimidazole-succinocarboxamide synthase
MKYDRNNALIQAEIPELQLVARGKVRDIFDLGENLLFIATDRISAFDVVMPNGIPNKGCALTAMTLFWLGHIPVKNHLIGFDLAEIKELKKYAKDLSGRTMIVKKATPLPIECVIRGYLTGSGWKDYQGSGAVCGIQLRKGYHQAEKLDTPLFTPSTKAAQGLHDENISYEQTEKIVGAKLATELKTLSLQIYQIAADYAETKGIILADTKFEFGTTPDNELILIDEVLTPDSSRFWPAENYRLDCSPPSFDKQFLRDYLETLDWNKTAPGPNLPDEIILKTREKYIEAYRRLSGKKLDF